MPGPDSSDCEARMATGTRSAGITVAGGGGEEVAPVAARWRRAHLTVGERVARGRAARTEAPRSAHGRWEPAPDRPDPIGLLEEQAVSRVADLVPIRYGRMLISPFTFMLQYPAKLPLRG